MPLKFWVVAGTLAARGLAAVETEKRHWAAVANGVLNAKNVDNH